jgi:hypothetical protein
MGAAPSNVLAVRSEGLLLKGSTLVRYGVKAFEKIVIGPCTLVRPGFPARCISQIRVCGFL